MFSGVVVIFFLCGDNSITNPGLLEISGQVRTNDTEANLLQ